MMNKAIELYKEHNTNLFHSDKCYTKQDIDNTFLQSGAIFNSIEDGISILDGDFSIQNHCCPVNFVAL